MTGLDLSIRRASKLSNDVVTLSMAARIAGVSRQAVTQHVERGHLRSVRIGPNRYIHRDDVIRLITQYAMTGRRPKHKEAVHRRKAVLRSIRKEASKVVDGLVSLLRRRDNAIAKIKNQYRPKLRAEIRKSRRAVMRAERDAKVRKVRVQYRKQINALQRQRLGLWHRDA